MSDLLAEHREGGSAAARIARASGVAGVGIAAVVVYGIGWRSGAVTHSALEAVAAAVAFAAAAMALRLHGRAPSSAMLLVTVGLWGSLVFDVLHGLVSAEHFAPLLPSDRSPLTAWSWLAARVWLGVFLLASVRSSSAGSPAAGRDRGAWPYVAGVVLGAIGATALLVARLPAAYQTDGVLGRPQDLLPGALFALALVVTRREARADGARFERWRDLALWCGAVGQLLFMPFSRALHDAPFDAAHALKIASYGLLLVGAVRETRRTPAVDASISRRDGIATAFSVRLAVVLSVLVLLHVAERSVVHQRFSETVAWSTWVNRAGRQRTQVVRAQGLAHRLAEHEIRGASVDEAQAELGQIARSLRESDRWLDELTERLSGPSATGPPMSPSAPDAREEFDQLVAAVEALAALPPEALPLGPRDHAAFPDDARVRAVVDVLDGRVAALERLLERRVERVARAQQTLFELQLAVLCVVAFVVFRPLIARLRATLAELAAANQVLAQRAEERGRALERTSRDLERIFDLSRDPICVIAADGRFRQANPACERLLGRPREEILSRRFLDFVHPDDRAATETDLERLLVGQTSLQLTNRYQAREGSWRWLDWSAVADPDEGHVYAVARDVTDQRALRAEIERTNQNLEARNRELQQFAYVASHDLKEPLRTVASFLDLLDRRHGAAVGEEGREFIEFAVDGAQRMQRLIDDILTFSRIETKGGALVPTRLEAILERVAQNLGTAIRESGARLSWNGLPSVLADEHQMVQLFQNLVGNAIKYHRTGVPPEVRIDARREGDRWRVSVADNGIGIDAVYHERIFAIFQRLHARDAYTGTGIGLAIVKRIVERHRGTIEVESDGCSGSTFHVTLPAIDEGAQ